MIKTMAWYFMLASIGLLRIGAQTGQITLSMLAAITLTDEVTHHETKEKNILWLVILLALATFYVRALSRFPALNKELPLLPKKIKEAGTTIKKCITENECISLSRQDYAKGAIYGVNIVAMVFSTLQSYLGFVKSAGFLFPQQKKTLAITILGGLSAASNLVLSTTFGLSKSVDNLIAYNNLEDGHSIKPALLSTTLTAGPGVIALAMSSFFLTSVVVEDYFPQSKTTTNWIASIALIFSILNTLPGRFAEIVLEKSGSEERKRSGLFSREVLHDKRLWAHVLLSCGDIGAYVLSLFGSFAKTIEHLANLKPSKTDLVSASFIAMAALGTAISAAYMHKAFTVNNITHLLQKKLNKTPRTTLLFQQPPPPTQETALLPKQTIFFY